MFSAMLSLKCISSFQNKIKETKSPKENMHSIRKDQKTEVRKGTKKWIRCKIKSPAAIPSSIKEITGVLFLSGMFLKGKKKWFSWESNTERKEENSWLGAMIYHSPQNETLFLLLKGHCFFPSRHELYLHKVTYNEEPYDIRKRSRWIAEKTGQRQRSQILL